MKSFLFPTIIDSNSPVSATNSITLVNTGYPTTVPSYITATNTQLTVDATGLAVPFLSTVSVQITVILHNDCANGVVTSYPT